MIVVGEFHTCVLLVCRWWWDGCNDQRVAWYENSADCAGGRWWHHLQGILAAGISSHSILPCICSQAIRLVRAERKRQNRATFGHSPLLAGYLHRIGRRDSEPVHTATALTRRQSTWCSGVQLMSRPEVTSGWEEYSTRIHDASGSSWSGLGRWLPPPDREWERERG